MKDWIKTCDGYVRTDAIIDVHTNQWYPGAIFVTLVNGDSVKYKDYGTRDDLARYAMEELMNYLTGNLEFITFEERF